MATEYRLIWTEGNDMEAARAFEAIDRALTPQQRLALRDELDQVRHFLHQVHTDMPPCQVAEKSDLDIRREAWESEIKARQIEHFTMYTVYRRQA